MLGIFRGGYLNITDRDEPVWKRAFALFIMFFLTGLLVVAAAGIFYAAIFLNDPVVLFMVCIGAFYGFCYFVIWASEKLR